MSKDLTYEEWLKLTEEHTKTRVPARIGPARTTFNKLVRETRLQLLEELVETRSAELCRAYRNVIDVFVGYKRSRFTGSATNRIARNLCITFLVKTKWSSEVDVDPNELLPKHLFFYVTVDDERHLCSVPTDVVDAREYAQIKPQAKRISVRERGKKGGVTGLIACAVRMPEYPQYVFALSCRHVFNMTENKGPRFVKADVLLAKTGRFIGTTEKAYYGELKNGHNYSLDAQACYVHDVGTLRMSLGTIKITSHARNSLEVPNTYWIHVANGGPKEARGPNTRISFSIRYPNVGWVIHQLLIEGKAITVEGDSGAACTSHKKGGRFLGMHIAGGGGIVFMIPAWHLMDRSRYRHGDDGTVWELIDRP